MSVLPNKHYDVAVLGLGAMGSFAALEVARRGFSVVGFDQFRPPHQLGSHSGGTRIFRVAYPEGTGYVDLARRAGDLWDQASQSLSTPLLHRSGMLYMGTPGEKFLREVKASAVANQLRLEPLTASGIHQRYPGFRVPETFAGLLDPQAGWIDVNAALNFSQAQAARMGADCFLDQPVLAWKASSSEVVLHARDGTVTAGRLIITAGAWTGELMHDLSIPLAIKRKVIAWFDPLEPELFADDRIPVFTFPEKSVYGFPLKPGWGVKLAEHAGGDYLNSADKQAAPPEPKDFEPLAAIVAKYMPRLAGSYQTARSRLSRSQTCLYTMTPDEDFVVDHHPGYKNVVFAAGFSGHGFKFAPLMAIALADLALEGKSSLPIDFLSLKRLRMNVTG